MKGHPVGSDRPLEQLARGFLSAQRGNDAPDGGRTVDLCNGGAGRSSLKAGRQRALIPRLAQEVVQVCFVLWGPDLSYRR